MRVSVLLGLLFLYSSLYAQMNSQEDQQLEDSQKEKIVKTKKKIPNFFEGKTDIEDPLSLRDPFKSPVAGDGESKANVLLGSRQRDILNSRLNFLETLEPSQLSIKGIFIGENRRAIARAATKGGDSNFLLEEGMKLGKNKAEVKAILPGGIIIVEKIVNIYNQEEYLETVIPISE